MLLFLNSASYYFRLPIFFNPNCNNWKSLLDYPLRSVSENACPVTPRVTQRQNHGKLTSHSVPALEKHLMSPSLTNHEPMYNDFGLLIMFENAKSDLELSLPGSSRRLRNTSSPFSRVRENRSLIPYILSALQVTALVLPRYSLNDIMDRWGFTCVTECCIKVSESSIYHMEIASIILNLMSHRAVSLKGFRAIILPE